MRAIDRLPNLIFTTRYAPRFEGRLRLARADLALAAHNRTMADKALADKDHTSAGRWLKAAGDSVDEAAAWTGRSPSGRGVGPDARTSSEDSYRPPIGVTMRPRRELVIWARRSNILASRCRTSAPRAPRTARTERNGESAGFVPKLTLATRARGCLSYIFEGLLPVPLPGVLRRAVPEESYRCWRHARPTAAARQGCRIRPGPRLCRHEPLLLEREALRSRLVGEN
jgi:hypothetical protein